MKILIDELLIKKNKTRYWLSKKIGITYPNLCKLCNNKTTSIKFEFLEKLCDVLECTPNDIFELEE
jgi:putative transcriptional regulator